MILVTGGSGMVGSELKKIMPEALYPSSKELNLLSEGEIRNYLQLNNVTAVIHLAAHVGSLHDNIDNRVRYFDDNVLMNTLITKLSYEAGIKKFIGILSTCIYPDSGMIYPMNEEQIHNGAPHVDLYSYAYAKRAHAVQLDNYKFQYGLDYSYLTPTNMYGYSNHTERLHFINDLVLKIVKAKINKSSVIELFGDGSPLRQFMFAGDFARFIKEYYYSGNTQNLNVGDPKNRSVLEMANIAINIADSNIKIEFNSAKPNGQSRKDVDMSKMLVSFSKFKFTSFQNGIKKLFNYYEKIL
tara:strand:- start:1607 stop:2500 length:894 start_codon:yes stop_codon:yes gene_type:complete